MMKKVYLCIDLKTFFASCECSERHLDPFKTNLVVADPTRGFRVIIVTVANSLGNIRVFELLPKLKTKKYGWCIA